jgi:hypothetical protein
VLYPAALLVGEYVRLRLERDGQHGGADGKALEAAPQRD